MQFYILSTKSQHNRIDYVLSSVKQDPILDQFSTITRPYPSVNDVKIIPFPAVHIRIANIWEYPLPPTGGGGGGSTRLNTHAQR